MLQNGLSVAAMLKAASVLAVGYSFAAVACFGGGRALNRCCTAVGFKGSGNRMSLAFVKITKAGRTEGSVAACCSCLGCSFALHRS